MALLLLMPMKKLIFNTSNELIDDEYCAISLSLDNSIKTDVSRFPIGGLNVDANGKLQVSLNTSGCRYDNS